MTEKAHMKIKMEFKMETNMVLGAFGLPIFEADSFNNTLITENEGFGVSGPEHRRKIASQLLEALEGSQHVEDEPYCGWLEEPMDLDVFGQSLVDPSSPTIPLDEEAQYISAPSSPLVSFPATPIQPTSPQELYLRVEDVPVIKLDEPVTPIPSESVELLESLEMILHQIQTEDVATTSTSLDEQAIKEDCMDDATALLDSLIKGDVEESQILDELAEFSFAMMDAADEKVVLPPASVVASVTSSESDDQEWTPPTSVRKNRAGTNQPVQRKPRKKSLKPEDRRLRKKEQNKTAATRYRIKKKAELEILLEEEAALDERNRQLQAQHDELASEVRYLKKLIREVVIGRSNQRR